MKSLISVAVLLLVFASTAYPQSYSIDWCKVADGGGTSAGGAYTVSGTIGQPDAGAMSGGNYSLTGGYWALIAAVQQPGAPLLVITRSGPNVILSWSATATGFVLESNIKLAVTNGWSAVSPLPETVNGFNYVTNVINPGNNFYRLRHP